MDLLVIGDCSVDQYMGIDDSTVIHDSNENKEVVCFVHGSKIPVHKFNSSLAGNACHVGIGCAKLGLNCSIYTELGNDSNGENFIKEFKKYGINTKYCNLNEDTSTNIHTVIWHANERTIFSYHEPRTYNVPFDTLDKPKWIYYTSLAHGFEEFQKKLVTYVEANKDIGFTFNPGSIHLENIESFVKILTYLDVIFVNKEEAQKISKSQSNEMSELHTQLRKLGPKITVITDGKNGASAFDGSRVYYKEAQNIEGPIVDKTGAGDSFAAAFLAALHYKHNIQTALDWGSKNSANIVRYLGCIDGLLSKQQILEE